jgi:hypothetical protein
MSAEDHSPEEAPRYTTADAVEYARTLRADAEMRKNPDPSNPEYLPYYEPYAPSDDVAYKLCSNTDPDTAIELMAARWSEKMAEYQGSLAADLDRERRERKRRQREREERRLAQHGKSLGSLVDELLAALQLLSETSAAPLGGRVSGNVEHPSRLLRDLHDDEFRRGQETVRLCIQALERDVEAIRLKALPLVALEPDERLRSYKGMTPYMVAIADRDQGSAKRVRESRERLGLDPETGYPARRDAA